jgi:hypothetical protein
MVLQTLAQVLIVAPRAAQSFPQYANAPEVSPAELGGIGYLPWQTTTFNGRGPGIARLVVQLAGRIRCGDTAGSRASSVTVTYELTDPGL